MESQKNQDTKTSESDPIDTREVMIVLNSKTLFGSQSLVSLVF